MPIQAQPSEALLESPASVSGHDCLQGIDHFHVARRAYIEQPRGTFKLGIEFVDRPTHGDNYIQGFGQIGHDYHQQTF
ncbi:MAG: tryptophan 7-halogenase [Proteobacteria bacterium]|nr:tryptophan 7-halogenase [Pseudomonadota bacterium]